MAKKESKKNVLLERSFGRSNVEAILVAGSGFFVDSYDNFIIGMMVPMLAYGYFGASQLDPVGDGWLKSASSWGNLFGQFGFAFLGDLFGRKKIYGIELLILMVGALGCAVAAWPTGEMSIVASLGIWRFILGIGVGGNYPVSAAISSGFSSSHRRGQMIATIFAMQGLGIIIGATVSIVVLAIFKGLILEDYSNLNYCWRIIAGFGIVPATLVVYYRLTIPETPRYAMEVFHNIERGEATAFLYPEDTTLDVSKIDEPKKQKNVFVLYREAFTTYFKKWSKFKVLLGCALTWFFLNIGYYGTNLQTSNMLTLIGYGKPVGNYSNHNEYIFDDVWNKVVGTSLINLAGTVPGYWFAVALIETTGRKPMQIIGFGMLTLIFLFLSIFFNQLTGDPDSLNIYGFIVLYTLAQLFFNFGPNTTTFVITAEVFPTKVCSTVHGISAASGKLGATIAAQLFTIVASSSIGVQGVLGIFSACCFLGGLFTFLVPETKGRIFISETGDYTTDTYKSEGQTSNSEQKDVFRSSNSSSSNIS